MGDWIAFWNSNHPIYANPRHREVHYRAVAQDILVRVPAGGRVLDYGCGEALYADLIAASAAATEPIRSRSGCIEIRTRMPSRRIRF